ncbi:MAG TPA: hypothetical protein VKJ01_02955, partial [Candidatus Solibacter sp.]|nr:hypothetical protein [Candidatus Solibacter sp.]
ISNGGASGHGVVPWPPRTSGPMGGPDRAASRAEEIHTANHGPVLERVWSLNWWRKSKCRW